MTGAVITKQEEGTFLMLFNRSGYVLNFSTNDFDVFTTNSIGEALCAKYGLSKGKSLIAYLNSASMRIGLSCFLIYFTIMKRIWNMSTMKIMRMICIGEVAFQDTMKDTQESIKSVRLL